VIRINLLPNRKRVQTGQSQLWLAVALAVVVVEIAGLFVFHGLKQQELKSQQRKNTELTKQINQAKAAVANHADVKAKLTRLREREDAIAKLQSARTGPTAVLLELARILTTGRGPSVSPDRLNQLRRDNPLAVYNPAWDARRLWLTKFVEQQRRVRLEGMARDGEDVSELARRMNLSSYFSDVRLQSGKQVVDNTTKLELVTFQLEAQVKY
jgi:type IV pilus assembly protein PilN